MEKKTASAITLTLLLTSMLTLVLNIQPVKATGTIYIRTDGSIDPPTANITTFDNITYTFTGIIYDEIDVERSNIIVDGDGNVLQGAGMGTNSTGIYIYAASNVTIKNLKIESFSLGILLNSTSFSVLSQNNITDNMQGVCLWQSSNNSISGNNITKNLFMSSISYSSNNTLTENTMEKLRIQDSFGNTIVGNTIGMIEIVRSSKNTFYHNNVEFEGSFESYDNEWDDGYPSGGNYWGDYAGVDVKNGLYQNETGSDGIGDIPRTIDANNTDRFPLMAPFSFFDAGTWNDTTYYVDIVSNSTLSHFHFSPDEGAFMSFWVKGETTNETIGFCRVAIPRNLLWVDDGWTALYGSAPLTYKMFPDENCTYLYFTYTNPYQNVFTTVTIYGTHAIPEFSSFLILPLLMTATLLATIAYRRKRMKSDIG